MSKKLALLVIFALLLAGCGPTGSPPTKVENPEVPSPSAPNTKLEDFIVGETIKTGDLELIVYDVTFTNGDGLFKPDAGYQYALVHIALKNTGKSTIGISSMLMFELRDKNGVSYDESFTSGSIVSSTIGGILFPQKVMRGELCFEVPKNMTEFELQVNPDVFGTKNVFSIKLNEFKEGYEDIVLPKSMQSESEFEIGDVIKVNTVEYIVHGIKKSMGKQYFGPKEGYEYIIIDVSITNKDTKTQSISSLLMYDLRDQTGLKMNDSIGASMATNGSLSGDIMPSKALRGEVAFEVPIGSTGLEFIIEPNAFNHDTAFIVRIN